MSSNFLLTPPPTNMPAAWKFWLRKTHPDDGLDHPQQITDRSHAHTMGSQASRPDQESSPAPTRDENEMVKTTTVSAVEEDGDDEPDEW